MDRLLYVIITYLHVCNKIFWTANLFVEFIVNGAMYTVGGIYRHPNRNVSHFVAALECVLHKINTNRTTVLAGDMNIDIVTGTEISISS